MILGDSQRFSSCAQFLVIYRYLGTFGVHKCLCFLKDFRSFSVVYFRPTTKV
jgi:hypothetical protein